MNTNEVIGHIMGIKNMDDLHRINRAAIEQMRHLQKVMTASFNIGDEVKFTNKKGNEITGKVVKINHKSVDVESGYMSFRVSPSLLTKINE